MFKKILFPLLFVMSVFLYGCSKTTPASSGCTKTESTLVASDSEVHYIQAYLAANSRTAIKAPSGFFYNLVDTGSGTKPQICSNVYVKYTGYLFSGFKFTENLTGSGYPLTGLIVGWQKGMELVAKGGTIILYIPPSLGYGSTAAGAIPANSYLIFSVQLVEVF